MWADCRLSGLSERSNSLFKRYASRISRFTRFRFTALLITVLTVNPMEIFLLPKPDCRSLFRKTHPRCLPFILVPLLKTSAKARLPRRISDFLSVRFNNARAFFLFLVAYGQLPSALFAAAGENLPSVFCAHALAETVFIFSFCPARLKCTLHELLRLIYNCLL